MAERVPIKRPKPKDQRGSIEAHRSPVVARYIIGEAKGYAKRHPKQNRLQLRKNALGHARKKVRVKLKTDAKFRKRARIEHRAAKRGVTPPSSITVGPVQKA